MKDFKFWFHGTDHISAIKIVKNGVDLYEGRRELDFSHGGGFYVSCDRDFAYNHARQRQAMRRTKKIALIVFELITVDLERLTNEGKLKEFMTEDDCWKKLTNFFRDGKDKDLEPGLVQNWPHRTGILVP